jgi:hypothetical protein
VVAAHEIDEPAVLVHLPPFSNWIVDGGNQSRNPI